MSRISSDGSSFPRMTKRIVTSDASRRSVLVLDDANRSQVWTVRWNGIWIGSKITRVVPMMLVPSTQCLYDETEKRGHLLGVRPKCFWRQSSSTGHVVVVTQVSVDSLIKPLVFARTLSQGSFLPLSLALWAVKSAATCTSTVAWNLVSACWYFSDQHNAYSQM